MLLPLLLPVLSALASAVEVKRPRGVSLTNHHFYEESKPFTCLDGSSTIAFDWVNDDYCDCQDGSDEPGTSACPNGRFHCTNAGYRPQYIPSSRVNDGVCDCCDATDEYNSGFVCENTCKEMGRKEREALAQMAEVAREGFQLKQVLIEEASKGREDKQKAAEKAAREQARASEAFQDLDDDGDGVVSVAELQTHAELDVDGDGTLSETEAQTLLGNALQADASSFQDTVWAAIKENYKPEAPREEAPEPQPDLPLEQPAPEDDYDDEEEEEGDDDESNEEEPKVPPPKQPSDKAAEEDEEEKMPPYDEATQALIDAAQKAREQFEEAEKSLKEMEDSIRSLEKEISFDFGPQGEFAYLYSQCYELATNE
ncbi:Glucosidase 2 subunit beta [Chelonia mydas]|uniref:Glucosidase 2 subunit beta n=1 Tax=Chelonia mydas TaxID=8469 RepID=M7BH80_CHEMY|nr:Glucosidase 2 subunit beta [Chelonia mydas]